MAYKTLRFGQLSYEIVNLSRIWVSQVARMVQYDRHIGPRRPYSIHIGFIGNHRNSRLQRDRIGGTLERHNTGRNIKQISDARDACRVHVFDLEPYLYRTSRVRHLSGSSYTRQAISVDPHTLCFELRTQLCLDLFLASRADRDLFTHNIGAFGSTLSYQFSIAANGNDQRILANESSVRHICRLGDGRHSCEFRGPARLFES